MKMQEAWGNDNAYKILVGTPEGKNNFVDIHVDERITLKWIMKQQGIRVYTGLNWQRIVISGGLLCTW